MDERKELIEKLREKGVEFNPNSQIATLKKLLEDTPPSSTLGSSDEEEIQPNLVETLSMITRTLGNIESRMSKLEGSQSNEYRSEAKNEDIERAGKMKEGVDPRIIQIVEESLGTDFGIEVKTFEDRPGFLFTVIVPQRLSDNITDSRPVRDEKTGFYKKDSFGNTVFEPYFPEDRRSKVIGSMQSFDAIKDHCDKVRSYIVSYYQKTKKPLPEFKLK